MVDLCFVPRIYIYILLVGKNTVSVICLYLLSQIISDQLFNKHTHPKLSKQTYILFVCIPVLLILLRPLPRPV